MLGAARNLEVEVGAALHLRVQKSHHRFALRLLGMGDATSSSSDALGISVHIVATRPEGELFPTTESFTPTYSASYSTGGSYGGASYGRHPFGGRRGARW